jgi:spore coat protein A
MTYYNDQQAATLWYHDHALGITRLNVYAGLAGFYVLEDQNRLDLVKQGVLPSGDYDLGMAIQDRAFTSDGQLYYPAYKNDPLPGTDLTVGDIIPQKFYDTFGEDAPSVVPEFFGDTILVNGMAWPNLNVAAGDYEFRLLNGSDSRFYVLKVRTLPCTSLGRTAGFSLMPLPSATATAFRKPTNSSFSRPATASNSCSTSATFTTVTS